MYFLRAYRDPADRLEFAKRKLRITQEAIESESELAHSFVNWSAVVRVDQTETHGFVYLASDSAYVIPRETVGGEAFEQFMARASIWWQDAIA